METPTTPLRGMDIIRQLLKVKRQAQREAVENYQTNPEVRAIVEELKVVNGKKKAQ